MDISAMLSSLSSSDYISIGGGILVIAVAVFIFRSGPKKEKPAKTELKKEPEPQTAEPAIEEEVKPKPKIKMPAISLGFNWKEKMQFLSNIRSRPKKNVEPQEEEVLIPEILLEDPDMDVALPVQEVYQEQVIPQEEEYVMADVAEESVVAAVSDVDIPAEGIQEEVYDETAMETQEFTTADEVKEEEETEEPAVEPAKEKSPDDIFSMFTEEDNEESEVSKFAATLEAVDIDDLMMEIDDLKKYMRK